MVATAHNVAARIAVPYSQVTGDPVYTFDFTTWTGANPSGWTTDSPATVARGYNQIVKKLSANVAFGAAGGSFRYTVSGLPNFTRYRVLATVRNVGTGPVVPVVGVNSDAGTPRGQMLPGDTRLVWTDFNTFLFSFANIAITTVPNPVSQAGVLAVDLVQLYRLVDSSVYDLHPTDASVSLDENWSPYARAALTCPMPPADVLAKIDPRLPQRVNLTLSRTGADSLPVSDLTAMLAADGPTQYNLAPNPRSNAWVSTAATPWASSVLTGPGVNPPNGVAGGSRFIAVAAAGVGDTFTLTQTSALAAGVKHLASVYARSSRDIEARFSATAGTVTKTKDVHLRSGRWNRVWVGLTTAEAVTAPVLSVQSLDPTWVSAVMDLTQVMIEPATLSTLGTNLDGANPSFEKPLSGGAAGGSATNTQDTTWGEQGTCSLKSVAASTNTGSYYVYGNATSSHMMADLGMEHGKTYTASVTCRVVTPQNTAGIASSARRLTINTQTGHVLSAVALALSNQAPNVAGVYRLKVTFTVPAGVDDVILRLYNGSATPGDTLWWDSLMVEEGVTAGVWSEGWVGGTPEQTEPSAYMDGAIGRVGDPAGFPSWTGVAGASPSEKVFGHLDTVADLTALFGAPVRRNLCTNPSFETGTTGWRSTNATLSNPTSGGQVGVRYLAGAIVLSSGTRLSSPWMAAAPGTVYTMSCWVKGTVGRVVRLATMQTTGAGGSGSTVNTTSPTSWTLTGAWQRISWTTEMGVDKVSFDMGVSATLTSTGDGIHVDGVLVELGGALGDYFDGSTAAAGGWTYSWTGTAHGSVSQGLLTTTVDSVAYLTDLFGDQFNAVIDTTLNQSRTFDLGLRKRSLDYIAGTMTLELAGDEMLLQDFGRVNTTEPTLVPLATSDLKTLVSWALNLIGTDLQAGAGTAVITTVAALDWGVGQSLWDFLDGYMNDAGLQLYCDENRRWYLVPPFTGSSGTDVITSLTGLDDDLDREGWGDAVILANHWTVLATSQNQTTFAGASVSTTASYTKSVQVDKVAKAAATPAGAAALLARYKGRGRKVGVQAVSDYLVTPGHTANIATLTTSIDPVLTSAVTWNLPADEMTVTTRDLP